MPLLSRVFMALGAVLAALSVALSAMAAHLPIAPAAMQALTASIDQQQFHALGLLLVGGLHARRRSWWLIASGALMLAGLLLFSLNIDVRVLWGWDAARALVPMGGGAFILSWIALALGVLWTER